MANILLSNVSRHSFRVFATLFVPVCSDTFLRTEDDYEPVNRWWERADGAESGKRGAKKWDTFEHHGPLGPLGLYGGKMQRVENRFAREPFTSLRAEAFVCARLRANWHSTRV